MADSGIALAAGFYAIMAIGMDDAGRYPIVERGGNGGYAFCCPGVADIAHMVGQAENGMKNDNAADSRATRIGTPCTDFMPVGSLYCDPFCHQ